MLRLTTIARRALGVTLLVATAAVTPACASTPTVTRVVDGRIVEGPFVEPAAYAAFVRGAIAEEKGDLKGALSAYEEAASLDEHDPEIWTRIAAVRCRTSPADPGVRWAAARALASDAEYAPAWEVRARCEIARGEDRVGVERDALRAADVDPRNVDYQILLARAEEKRPRSADAAEKRLVALTLAHGTSTAAWEALASWNRSHGDALGAAAALARVARLAPSRAADIAREVVAFAGDGEIAAARVLAGVVVDVGRDPDRAVGGLASSPAHDPRVGRLAVDAAILDGDVARARGRAVAAHLGLARVAARALLLGRTDVAVALVEPVAAADPDDVGARAVRMAIASARDRATTPRVPASSLSKDADPHVVPAECALVLLAAVPVADDARRVADALPTDAIVAGDDVVVRAAVELAARGALDERALPLDGKIELAARRGVAVEVPLDGLDARHRALALAIGAPSSLRTTTLLLHLTPALARDPIVLVAAARVAASEHREVDLRLAERLSMLAPGDPLALSVALEIARRRGDARATTRLKDSLRAVAVTPNELRLTRE